MKKNLLLLKLFLGFFLFVSGVAAQQLAFPGAEGYGRFATGGRTGTVYHVTNLNDSGTGSFRDAVSSSNRIVVFDVAGVIRISSRMVVSSNIYIAGQTAPGEGVTIYGNGFSFSGAHNTICRYLKVRMGNVGDTGKDALGIANGHDMIFDHVSVSWGRDETFSISGADCYDITIQNSIIAQGLLSHSAGGLIQPGGGVTLYRNFYVDNDTRNNKVKGINQYVNNIVYHWKSAAYIMGGGSEGDAYANVVSNYFVKGTVDGANPLSGANEKFHIYAEDNWSDNNQNGVMDGYLIPESEYSGGPDFQAEPFDYPILPTMDATKLIDSLIPGVGASLPYRDYVDYYVVNELKSFGKEGAFITTENELPFGAPDTWSLWAGAAKADADKDGMPDAWEEANGLNKSSAADAMTKAANGYTNIENYINSITTESSQFYLRTPLNLVAKERAQNSITLSWFDYTENESGYVVEQQINGVFTQIKTTIKDGNLVTVDGLTPESSYVFRVKAVNGTASSAYSNELTVKTKPVPVEVLDIVGYLPDLIWRASVDGNWDKTTANWIDNGLAKVYTDKSALLFDDFDGGNQTVTITAAMSPEDVVVNADNNYTLSGTGSIGGDGSVNKAGAGTLALLSNNTYTGATVLWGGTMEINKLANGGVASSIGASPNYDFNWVWLGGKTLYTGASVSTDRNVKLEDDSEFSVDKSSATVTFTGSISGSGGLSKSGSGNIVLKSANAYEGETTVSGGILEVNGVTAIDGGFGTSGVLNLDGGTFKSSGGSTSSYEYYYMAINVAPGKTSGFEPYRNCYIKSAVKGGGILNFNVSYVREYLQGDWSQFSGQFNANGIGTSNDGSQLILDNTIGLPNAVVKTSGNIRIVCWKNASTMSLGGLSGPAGTYLSGADKKNNAATMTWVVGGAGTEETFNGVINNECSANAYKGVTSIVKDGTGIWRLTGNNIYSGTTTVNDGTLLINGTYSGLGDFTVNEGVLGGSGNILGDVTVNSGGTIAPGDNSISTLRATNLTLKSGSVTQIEIDKVKKTNDKLSISGKVTYGGSLDLLVDGVLEVGDKFYITTSGSSSGTYESITHNVEGFRYTFYFSNGILEIMAKDSINTSVDYSELADVAVYPNPVVDKLIVKVNEGNAGSVSIYDISGLLVWNSASNETQSEVDFTNMKPGIYFVKIKTDLGIITKVVMKN